MELGTHRDVPAVMDVQKEENETDDENEDQLFLEPMNEDILNEPVYEFVFEAAPKNVVEVVKVTIPVELNTVEKHEVTVSPEAVLMCESLEIDKRPQLLARDNEKAKRSQVDTTKKYETDTETFVEKSKPSVHQSNEFSRILQSRAIVVLERCSLPSNNYCKIENEEVDENSSLAETEREMADETEGEKQKKLTDTSSEENQELGISNEARKCRPSRRKRVLETAEQREKRLAAKRLATRKWRAMKRCLISPGTQLGISDGVTRISKGRSVTAEQQERRLLSKRLATRKFRAMKKSLSPSPAHNENYIVNGETEDKHNFSVETEGEEQKKLSETSPEENQELGISNGARKCRPRSRKRARETSEQREKRLAAKRLATRKWRAMKRCMISSGAQVNNYKVNDEAEAKQSLSVETGEEKHEKVHEEVQEDELRISDEAKHCDQKRIKIEMPEQRENSFATKRLGTKKWREMKRSVKLSTMHYSIPFDKKLERRAIVVLERCCISPSSSAITEVGRVKSEPEDHISYETGKKNEEKTKETATETFKLRAEARNLSIFLSAVSMETIKPNKVNETLEQPQQIEERCPSHEPKKQRRVNDIEKQRMYKPNETPEQRERRLKAHKERQRERRANETPEQRQNRLEANKKRKEIMRATETPEQRQKRYKVMADCNRRRRAKKKFELRAEARKLISLSAVSMETKKPNKVSETLEQQQQIGECCPSNDVHDTEKQRRKSTIEKQRMYRANETPEQREKRLKADKERQRERRANETLEQSLKRRAANAKRKEIVRANETPEQRQKRFKIIADCKKRRRANETPEEREKRLEIKRLSAGRTKELYEKTSETQPEACTLRDEQSLDYSRYFSNGSNIMVIVNEEDDESYSSQDEGPINEVANETPEQYEKRLAENERIRKLRSKETPEQREKRLKADKERKREQRANESPEQRKKRLEALAQREKEARANATAEQREKRRKIVAECRRRRRANETPEEREKRLAVKREHSRRMRERRRNEKCATHETPQTCTFRKDESLDDYHCFSSSSNVMVIVNEEEDESYPSRAESPRNEEADETLDPRERRRLAKNLARRNRRANETPEQRQKRLAARNLARWNKRLASETPEEREKRLETAKKSQMEKSLASGGDKSLENYSCTNSFDSNICNEELFGTFFSHCSNAFDDEDGAAVYETLSNASNSSYANMNEDSDSSQGFVILNGDHIVVI